MAALSLAIVLSAPHLYVYDLALLASAFVWLVDWTIRSGQTVRLGRVLYLAFLAPLASPFVPLIRVQISTLTFAVLIVVVFKWRGAPPPRHDTLHS